MTKLTSYVILTISEEVMPENNTGTMADSKYIPIYGKEKKMKTDKNGCSTCSRGQEQFEKFHIKLKGKKVYHIQYDYRTMDGELFATTAKTVEKARMRRDAWLANRGGDARKHFAM